jgi:hypothetical protein
METGKNIRFVKNDEMIIANNREKWYTFSIGGRFKFFRYTTFQRKGELK